MTLLGIVRIRNRVFAGVAFGLPLMGACGTLGQFPLVAEEGFEIAVVPLGWRGGPGDFKAAGDGVGPDAGTEAVLPAESHLLNACSFGFRAYVARRGRAVGLAEGVTAGD